MSIKVLIGCAVKLFAEGLEKLLGDYDVIEVIGSACDQEKFSALLRLQPDIILVDPSFFRRLIKSPYQEEKMHKLLLIKDDSEDWLAYQDLQEMVGQGLTGVLPCQADSSQMKKAIQEIHRGDLWIDHKTIRNSLFREPSRKKNIPLTRREKEVLDCLCSGFTNKKIAQKLIITEQTVKSHCNRLFKKFGVSNRLQLAIVISGDSKNAEQRPSIN